MRKIRHLLVAVSLSFAGALLAQACTSSSSNVSTNPGYQKSYQTPTRSRQSSRSSQEQGFPQETYRPPVTLEMVAMNTGEVLVGEQYPIVAVVDNPENRDLTYRWTAEDGTFAKAPESMRSELVAYIQEIEQAKALPGAEAGLAGGENAEADVSGGGLRAGGRRPGRGGISFGPSKGGTSEPTPPPGASRAESEPPPPTTAEQAPSPPSEQPAPGEKPEVAEPATETTSEEGAPSENEQDTSPKGAGTNDQASGSQGSSDSLETTQDSLTLSRQAVLAPEEEAVADVDAEDDDIDATSTDENEQPTEAVPAELHDSPTEESDDETSATEEPTTEAEESTHGTPSQEDAPASEVAAEVGQEVEVQGDQAAGFKGFQPKAGTGRLVEVQESPSDEEETADAGESETPEPPLVEFETDEPYVLWTPPALGTYTIGVVVLDGKGNELTPKRSFPVTVTEPTPTTELVWNTSRKLLEDDYLVVELRGHNIPVFDKGLFTINFDPSELSFKVAEPGNFFPEGYRTSIYFAQPPGMAGKVTIAIAAEEVALPKGDGVIARIIFKVKNNVDNPATLQISEATTPDTRYILDPRQENVLPVVMRRPAPSTEWVEPPAAPQQARPKPQPREQLPETPAPPSGTEGTRPSRPTFGGSAGAPPTGGTEGTGQPSPSAGSTEQAGTEGESSPTVELPGGTGEPSVEQQISMLEQQKVRLQNDPNLTEEEKADAIARIEADIARLRAGETP